MTRQAIRTLAFSTLLAGICTGLAGCGGGEDVPEVITAPSVALMDAERLVVGEPLGFFGPNFLHPADGTTNLQFEGVYVWEDDGGQQVVERINPFTIAPLYDGEFDEGGGTVRDVPVDPGTRALRWSRVGPFEVPFTSTGNRPGVFKGEIVAINYYNDGRVERGDPSEAALEIEPSIIITKLEPVIGGSSAGIKTPGCSSPALRGIGGLPYVLEVEAVGFEPEFFVYEVSNVNGKTEWTEFTHTAKSHAEQPLRDRVGDPSWHPGEIMVFNALNDDEGYSLATIRVTGVDKDNRAFHTALPFSIVRPVAFHYNGNRDLAEYYDPEVVHGPIVGGIGTTVTYAESHSEARQQGVSLSVNRSWSAGQGRLTSENWSEGVSQTDSVSQTNSEGRSHSESESAQEAYGTSYSNTEAARVDVSSSNGTNWGWNTTEGKSQEDYEAESAEAYGEVSGEVTTTVGGEGSVPGFAKVSGSVGTSVGARAGGKTGTTTGNRVGTSSSLGHSAGESESETQTFGSVTTDGRSESLSGSFALASQETLNSQTAETAASSESTTYQMGGNRGLSENYTEGESESWSETWVKTSSDQQLLSYSGKVPRGRCAVVYRQTVRHVRKAYLYNYDLCGVRTLAGEMLFNEWSWSPNIAMGDDCDSALPPSTQPKAACFIGCE